MKRKALAMGEITLNTWVAGRMSDGRDTYGVTLGKRLDIHEGEGLVAFKELERGDLP